METAKKESESMIAEDLRKMHYKIIFDVDNGVNTQFDNNRYLASIYAAKLTIQHVKRYFKEFYEATFSQKVRDQTGEWEETEDYELLQSVFIALEAKEEAFIIEKFDAVEVFKKHWENQTDSRASKFILQNMDYAIRAIEDAYQIGKAEAGKD